MKLSSKTDKGFMQRMIPFLCVLSFLLAFSNVLAENKDLVLFDYQEEGKALEGSIATIPVTSLPVSVYKTAPATSTVVIDHGDSKNRIDLVFLADGYTATEQDSFNLAVQQFSNGIFQQTPFKEYKEFFNIHRVNIPSVDSGASNYPENGISKNTALGSYFYCNGAAHTICTNVSKAWEYAAHSRGQDQIIVLSNVPANGASAYPFSSLSVVSAGHNAGADSLLHQLGHSFGNLADEYSTGSWPEYTGFEPAEINVSAQSTQRMIDQKLKWHHWIGENPADSVLGPISGYAGAMGHQSGIYRPTLTSRMRDLSQPFNAPSIEAFIKKIYKKVTLIDDASPSDLVLTGSDTLFISHPKPAHNDFLIEWYVGGVLVEGADQPAFRPNDFRLENGLQEVRVKIIDKTTMVKDELFRSQYMQEERAWNVEITQVAPSILTHPDTLSLFVDEQGSFAVSANGEDLSYQWYKNGILIEGATESLYTTLPVSKEDHESSYHVVVRNIAGIAESQPAKLYIKNRAPVLYEIPNFAMYRSETFQFSLKVSDPDGDTLSFSVESLDEVENETLIVTVVNTKLHISANNAALGTRRFRVTASDGEFDSTREFSILVRNNPPVISPIPEVKKKPGSAPFHVPFTAYDPDGDPLSFSVAIITSGARASVSVDGNSILIAPENDYIGSFTVRLDASDGFQNVFTYFKVSIADTSPIITSLPLVNQMHWREKELVIPIIAHDPDGDELTYSVEPLTQTDRVTLVMSGNSIVVTKDDTYLGFFYAKAIVSDGFNITERKFYINVANKSPIVETIPPVSIHWKAGFVDIPLTVIDSDPLDAGHHTCSANTVGNAPNVVLEINNCVLRIIPPNKYLGSFSMHLFAHDGISSSTSRGLKVTVYNSSPTIDPIPDQIIRKGVSSHMVPVPASDPDGDELTITAEVAEPGKASVLAFDVQDKTLVITPQNGFNGSIPVKVSVSDGIASASTTFNFVSENKPPVLSPLPDLRLHWIKDQVYVLELFADDPDDALENLVFTAEILKSTMPDSTLQVSGNTLNITMPEKFLGSFPVKITVSDGEFNDSGIFTVYSANAPPEISPVCDHAFTHAEAPYEINLEVVDPDEEELEYTVRIEHYPLPYELKSVHQFRKPEGGWRYNSIGLGEKFLRGTHKDSNEDGWFIITPSGDIYQFEGTLASSTHVAKLPEVYHTDPDLLINAVLPVGQPDVQVTSEEEVLRVIPGPEFKGSIIVFVRAEDQQLFDEESFLVTVYGHEVFLNTQRNIEFHWREQGQLSLSSQSESMLPIAYQAGFADISEAFALQIHHQFGSSLPRSHYQTDNATGRGEKYFLGTQGSANHFLYGIVPTGEVFLCHGTISGGSLSQSELLGRVSPLFYHYPELWFAVPPPGEAPLEFVVTDASLQILPEKGFIGNAIISISAMQDQSIDTQDVLVSVYNSIPSLESAQGIPFSNSPVLTTSWKAGEISVPLTYFDLDTVDQGELRLFAKEGVREEYIRSLIAEYDIEYRADTLRFNETGWREKYLAGTYQGLDVDFAILPQGGVYQWKGTKGKSVFIGFLPEEYYSNPELINALIEVSDLYHAVGAEVRIEGSNVVIQSPADFTGTFTIYAEVSDGISARAGEFEVNVVNSPPAFSSILPVTKHMRGGPALTVLHASDPDNDPLQFSIAGVASNGGALPLGLELNGKTVSIENAPLYKGSFSVLASVSDGTHTIRSQFPVQVVNSPPVLSSIPDKIFGWEQQVVDIPLHYYDPDVQDADRLSVYGFVGTIRTMAHALDSQYHFRAPAHSRVSNQAGYGEKYLQGMDGSTLRELVILPGGGLYFWDMNVPLEPAIAFLPVSYYENPALLFNVESPESYPAASISIHGSTLSIQAMSQKFTGSFPLTVIVNDGYDSSFRTFQVSYVNHAPTLAPISNRVHHWRGQIPSVSMMAHDPNGDPLSYSVQQLSGGALGLQVAGAHIQVQAPQQYVGQAFLRAAVSDGQFSAHRDFSVTLTNNAPVMSSLGSTQVGWKERVTKYISAQDPDGDPLTLKAIPTGHNAQKILARIENQTLFVEPITPFDGSVQIAVEASDGPSKVSRIFTVNFVNSAPQIAPIATITIPWRTASLPIPILVSDPDEDEVTIDVRYLDGMEVSYSIDITPSLLLLTFNEVLDPGSFTLEVRVSDEKSTTKRNVKVEVVNNAPKLKKIPPQYLEEGNTSHSMILEASDKDDDPLEYAVEAVSVSDIGQYIKDIHRFFEKSPDHDYNNLGNSEKYFFGYRAGSNFVRTYVLFPDGNLYEWAGSLVNSTHVTYVPYYYYTNPSELFKDIKDHSVPVFGYVNNIGPEVHIAPDPQYVGEVWFKASVTDSIEDDYTFFRFTVDRFVDTIPEDEEENSSPVLPDDGVDSGRRVAICHVPSGNLSAAHTIRVSPAALRAHLAHGDFIGECPGDPDDPGDGERSCEEKQLFSSPNYTLWNSFLGMINILELTNASDNDQFVTISFYSITGALSHRTTVRVPAVNQFDIIVNEFPGFVSDSYGIVKLEFDGSLDGRMMYYRPSADAAGYDYAYGMPLEDAQFGTTAVGFNTFQPSVKPEERDNIVANWLSIVNLASTAKRFTVLSYDISGSLILKRELQVPSFGRLDIDGGHDLAGANTVGYHRVVPSDISAEYISMVTRFGGNAQAGYAPSAFKFAFPLSAKLGQSDPVFLPISRKFGESNWIEVVNILDTSVGATINYYASDGTILESLDAVINPNAQLHFNASDRLPEGGTGFAMIIPKEPRSVIAQSMGYLREATSGSVTSVYGAQARRAVPCVQSGSYNLFLQMQNWLLVGNPTNKYVEATIHLTGPSMSIEKNMVLAPKSSRFLPIHDSFQYHTQNDTYGLLAVYPADPSIRLYTQIMRVRFRPDGTPDFSAPLPVR